MVILGWILGLGCGDPGPATGVPQASQVGSASPSADREAKRLGPARRVAAADFDGDGVDETVLVHEGVARYREHAIELGGEVQVVRRVDPAGDGKEIVLLGTGMGRTDRSAPTRIWWLGERGPELVFERRADRNQVADLDWVDGRIWAALWGTGKAVEAGWVEGRALPGVDTRNLATAWLPLGPGRRVVGRVYGDAPKAPGDLRLVEPEGERVLPTLRGVRTLEAADLDGDGHDELLVGDGWHHAYGKQAVARVRVLEGPGWESGRTVAMFDGEYTVWSVAVVEDALLATGTKGVHWLKRDALGWSDTVVAPVHETGNAVPFQDADGWWALVSGNPAQLVPLD